MKALTIRQPWATLIALGVKRIETRSWRAPASLIGQRLAIHAGRALTYLDGDIYGDYIIATDDCDRARMQRLDESEIRGGLILPLGAIVATATLTDCVPMLLVPRLRTEGDCITECNGTWRHHHEWNRHEGNWTDVSDQLPYGWFAPGRWAWMLDDVKPTSERCPACLGECRWFDDAPDGVREYPCGVCDHTGRCQPVPAKGKQGVWNWEPL